MVAFINYDLSVVLQKLAHFFVPGQGLQQRNIYNASHLAPASTNTSHNATSKFKKFSQSLLPLSKKFHPMHKDE